MSVSDLVLARLLALGSDYDESHKIIDVVLHHGVSDVEALKLKGNILELEAYKRAMDGYEMLAESGLYVLLSCVTNGR